MVFCHKTKSSSPQSQDRYFLHIEMSKKIFKSYNCMYRVLQRSSFVQIQLTEVVTSKSHCFIHSLILIEGRANKTVKRYARVMFTATKMFFKALLRPLKHCFKQSLYDGGRFNILRPRFSNKHIELR